MHIPIVYTQMRTEVQAGREAMFPQHLQTSALPLMVPEHPHFSHVRSFVLLESCLDT